MLSSVWFNGLSYRGRWLWPALPALRAEKYLQSNQSFSRGEKLL